MSLLKWLTLEIRIIKKELPADTSHFVQIDCNLIFI